MEKIINDLLTVTDDLNLLQGDLTASEYEQQKKASYYRLLDFIKIVEKNLPQLPQLTEYFKEI